VRCADEPELHAVDRGDANAEGTRLLCDHREARTAAPVRTVEALARSTWPPSPDSGRNRIELMSLAYLRPSLRTAGVRPRSPHRKHAWLGFDSSSDPQSTDSSLRSSSTQFSSITSSGASRPRRRITQ
jgi:hypothetical protein